jgi:hypothetical protein
MELPVNDFRNSPNNGNNNNPLVPAVSVFATIFAVGVIAGVAAAIYFYMKKKRAVVEPAANAGPTKTVYMDLHRQMSTGRFPSVVLEDTRRDTWEIDFNEIIFGELIGAGAFGEVGPV